MIIAEKTEFHCGQHCQGLSMKTTSTLVTCFKKDVQKKHCREKNESTEKRHIQGKVKSVEVI